MCRRVWLWCLIALPCAVGHAQQRVPGALATRPVPEAPFAMPCPPPDAKATVAVTAFHRCPRRQHDGVGPWQRVAPQRSSLWSVPASAVVPGAGQVMLGVLRFVPYVAVEAYGWWRYSAHRRDFRQHRSAYRDLAATVARAPYTANPPVGDFTYYEHMSHWLESGAFDRIPGGAIDPELDSSTYNGAIWLLARRTYWSDVDDPPSPGSPQFQRAMSFYTRRAYDPAFQWSWRGAEVEHTRFRRLIGDANDANRRAMQHVGLLVANHVLSTIDAYVTVRLRRQNGPAGLTRWELSGSVPFGWR